MTEKKEITQVRLDGEWVSITSPKLDEFCNLNGDLVIPAGDGEALVLEGWRDEIRQVPS